MAVASLIRNTFLGGEIGPKSHGRTDLPQYPHCHEKLLNVLTLPQGPAQKRPGFGFMAITQDNLPAACYPFSFSENSSYVLEVSSDDDAEETYIRVYDADAPFTSEDAVEGSINDFYIPSEILPFLQFSQSADVVWFVHGDVQPVLLIRKLIGGVFVFTIESVLESGLCGSLEDHEFFTRQPFRTLNIEDIELHPSGTSGSITVDAASAAAAPVYMFDPGMVGTYFKITQTDGGQRYTGSFKVTAMSGAANGDGMYAAVTADVVDAIKNTTADADWEEAAWSDYRGWPRTVQLFESRVYYWGNRSEPDREWASESGNYFNMDPRGYSNGSGFPSVTADRPYTFTPNSGLVSESSWLSAGKTLLAGARGVEYVLRGPDQTLSMGPTNISMSPETAHGSKYTMPARVAYTVMFVQSSGKKLRELLFDFNSDSYQATDIGLHAHHLLDKVIVNIVWQEQPNGILWCRTEDGELISVTRERQQNIIAWNSHSLPGTGATLMSMCVVPTGAGLNRLFAVIKRTIDEVDTYTMEYLAEIIDSFQEVNVGFANCLDGHVAAAHGTAQATWTGFDHLIGETVRVVSSANQDGSSPNVHGDFVINASGDLVLDRNVKSIIAGLPFMGKIKTLKSEGGSAIGTAQGDMKRTHKLLLRLYNTFQLSYGSNDANQKDIVFWSGNQPGVVQLFSGDKYLDFPNGWDRDGQVQIQSESPFPFAVNFIVSKMVVNES